MIINIKQYISLEKDKALANDKKKAFETVLATIISASVVLTGCTNTSGTAVSTDPDKNSQDTEIREDTSLEIADIKTDADTSDTVGETYENDEDGRCSI